MSLNSQVQIVRDYLASQYMYVDGEWLTGCVEYVMENTDFSSESEILSLIKEQWLLNNLKEICPGSLPANLKMQHHTTLVGRFVLQINATLDIGTAAYQQYLKIQKVNIDNIEATLKSEERIPSHRMLKLFLTDGVQDISAIEYKPMRNLTCDITPGCKILLKGPVNCRRGILLLTENSIELLGGEVQEIVSTNSLIGLLSKKLGVTITRETANNNLNLPRHINRTPHTQIPPVRILENSEPAFEQNLRPIARVTSVQLAHNFADDDIDIDQLDAIEAQISATVTKRPLNDDNSKPEKKIKMADNLINYPKDDDLFEEDEDYLRELEAKFDTKCNSSASIISSEPFVYIKQIVDMEKTVRAGRVFRVKGQIMKLLSKLSVGKDSWSLRCTIIDGTGSIDVDFTSDVLTKLVGFSPQEMNQIKKEMAVKPELKENTVSALQKARDTLQVLYCIIEITILDVPKITSLIPFEESDVEALKRRMKN